MHTQIHVCIQHLYAVLFSRTVAFACPAALPHKEWVPGGVSSTKDFLFWLCSPLCSELHADRAEVDLQKGWGDPGLNAASSFPLAGDILGCSVLVQDDKDTQGSVLMDVCTPEGTQVPYHGKKGRGSLCLYLFISYRAVCFTSSWGNLAERSPSPLLGEAGEEQKIK